MGLLPRQYLLLDDPELNTRRQQKCEVPFTATRGHACGAQSMWDRPSVVDGRVVLWVGGAAGRGGSWVSRGGLGMGGSRGGGGEPVGS